MQIAQKQNESGRMFDTISDSEINEKAQSIVEHLRIESDFLDSVIDSSLEMQSLLRDRQTFQSIPMADPPVESDSSETSPSTDGRLPEPNQSLTQRLLEIREQIAIQFRPILEGRRKMVENMNSISPTKNTPPSVTALTLKINEPLRSELKNLRNGIRSKLNQVHSISMGSQAVLLYTMDFYHRLLNGFSRGQSQSSYYDASGRSQNNFAVNLIETNG